MLKMLSIAAYNALRHAGPMENLSCSRYVGIYFLLNGQTKPVDVF